MRYWAIKTVFVCIIISVAQSCRDDSVGYRSLSIDDLDELVLSDQYEWDSVTADQYVGAVYAQGDQYAVFMPMDSCKMHFYDKDLNFLYSRVTIGQGPGEFVSPLYCSQWRVSDSGDVVSALYDSHAGRIMEVSSDYDGGREIAVLPKCYDLFPGYMVSDQDNKIIYGVSSYMSCELGQGVMFRYDVNSDSLCYSVPTFSVGNRDASFYLMQKAIAGSHDCRCFVNAYLYEPIIELWDNNMKLVASWKLEGADMVDRNFNYDTSTSFFRGVQICDRYIYILYYGRPNGSDGDSYILVFDKSGTPAFKINVGASYWFTVNEITRTIIMMRRNQDGEPAVWIASLPLV